MTNTDMDEKELPDDYPVHPMYVYVADGEVIRCDIEGTVGELKHIGGYKIITNCDIGGRGLFDD